MKVLIVGLGAIAKKHIAAIRRLKPDSVIYALRRSDVSNLKLDDDIINIYDLRDIDIDFAIISNPTSEHAKSIEQISELNIPLFIEKPLFDLANYDLIVDTVIEKGIATYIACNLRFLDSLVFVKKFIAGKRINEVNAYCGSYLPDWRPNVDFRTVYSANKELGGGVHIDLIHEIDYCIWMFGFPNDVRKKFSNISSLDISAFDYANYLMSYESFSVNVILNYYRKSSKRILEIVCKDGECQVDLLRNEVKWNDEIIFSSKQRIIDTYEEQMNYFIQHVVQKAEEKYFNDIVEAYKILKICLED